MDNRASLNEFARGATRIDGLAFGGHRGWLHTRSDGAPIRGGVVLCQPFGREARNAHRSLWLLAERMAASGFAVLRYDHLGTAESLPLPEADGWEMWINGVEHACDLMRREVGVQALALCGLRLGASLAAIATSRVGAEALMLLAPVVKGRVWLRELQIETALISGHAQSVGADGGFDANGIWLERQTLDGLKKLDLLQLSATAPKVFLAAHGDGDTLLPRLEMLGAQVQTAAFEGYDELFKDAYLNSPPEALFQNALTWLRKVSAGWQATPAIFGLPSSKLEVPCGTERAVAFGKGLLGVLCTPEVPTPERKAVILVNTGGDPRAGIGGFAADVSHELCRRGIGSLRFDLAGLGDSAFDEDWRSHVYETPRDGDFDAAITLLQTAGFSNLVVAGICSGGYHALQIASRDSRIAAAYTVNAAILAWRTGDPLTPPPISEGWNKPWLRNLAQQVLSLRHWRRAFAGEINWTAILSNIALRLKRRFFARLDRKMTSALRRSMKQLSRRGGRARLVVGSLDASLDELETHFGRDGKWLSRLPGMSIGIMDGLDHGLFFRESRRLALDDLVSYVVALPAAAPQAANDPAREELSADAGLTAAAAQ